jgi:hypothetical protein
MASFQYFATLEESLSILDALAKRDLRLIPDPGSFDEPRAPSYDQVTEEVREILGQRPLVYFTGSFCKYPPVLRPLTTGPMAGKYAIAQLEGGPLFQMLVSSARPYDGHLTLIGGDLSHQSYFKNPETGALEDVSADVRAAFKAAVAVMKKHLVQRELGGKLWIGPEAWQLFTDGKVLLQHAGKVKSHQA